MEALMTPRKAVSPSLFGANLQLNGTLRHLSFTWTKSGTRADECEVRNKSPGISQTTICKLKKRVTSWYHFPNTSNEDDTYGELDVRGVSAESSRPENET